MKFTGLPLNPTPVMLVRLKLIPSIVTRVKLVWPRPGKKFVITGALVTVKVFELVVTPPDVVTEIFPVVALGGTVAWIRAGAVAVAVESAAPLNFTVTG